MLKSELELESKDTKFKLDLDWCVTHNVTMSKDALVRLNRSMQKTLAMSRRSVQF